MPLKKMTARDHFVFWGFKLFNAFLFVGLPIWMLGFTSWIVGFLIFTSFAGLVLSLVFQLAHTVEHTSFPMPDEAAAEWTMNGRCTRSRPRLILPPGTNCIMVGGRFKISRSNIIVPENIAYSLPADKQDYQTGLPGIRR